MAAVKETACGAEWPSLTSCGVQCKAGQRDATSQSEVKLADHSCQAHLAATSFDPIFGGLIKGQFFVVFFLRVGSLVYKCKHRACSAGG